MRTHEPEIISNCFSDVSLPLNFETGLVEKTELSSIFVYTISPLFGSTVSPITSGRPILSNPSAARENLLGVPCAFSIPGTRIHALTVLLSNSFNEALLASIQLVSRPEIQVKPIENSLAFILGAAIGTLLINGLVCPSYPIRRLSNPMQENEATVPLLPTRKKTGLLKSLKKMNLCP